jgi:DNA-binding HxlR family transcriptional regulator
VTLPTVYHEDMLGRDYPDQVCSIARALEVVGERWTLLIVRDVLFGRNRFEELVESLGVTRTVLTARLRTLEDVGVLSRSAYQDNPPRFEYHLTEKGRGLQPVLAHLMWWGDEHYPRPEGPPRVLSHSRCGGRVQSRYVCGDCGETLGVGDVTSELGETALS